MSASLNIQPENEKQNFSKKARQQSLKGANPDTVTTEETGL